MFVCLFVVFVVVVVVASIVVIVVVILVATVVDAVYSCVLILFHACLACQPVFIMKYFITDIMVYSWVTIKRTFGKEIVFCFFLKNYFPTKRYILKLFAKTFINKNS